MEIKIIPGQTEITPDEKYYLKLPITTMDELNAMEYEEIAKTTLWALSARTLKTNDIFSFDFIKKLHKRMFGAIWTWAGQLRTSEKNIGVPVHRIQEQLKCLIDDAHYWVENKTYPSAEIAMRFHHKLVQIHIFNNGNGRHARLLANCFLKQKENCVFNWGHSHELHTSTKMRERYLMAMQLADGGDFSLLLTLFKTQPA